MFQALIPFTVKIKFVEVAVKFACNLSSEKAQVPFAMPTKFEYRAVSLNEPSVPITRVSEYPGTITFAPFNVFALKTHSPARRDFFEDKAKLGPSAYLLQEVRVPAPMISVLKAITNSFFMISSLNKSTHSLELIQELA